MKLSQLIPAGDYLSYKGDWVTNTAYNINECVTWTDGHLYQVIKEHTSSDTIAPSNAEYYKAMTTTKYIKHTYSNIGTQQIKEIINIFKKVKDGKNVYAAIGNDVYMPTFCGTGYCEASRSNFIAIGGTPAAFVSGTLQFIDNQIKSLKGEK